MDNEVFSNVKLDDFSLWISFSLVEILLEFSDVHRRWKRFSLLLMNHIRSVYKHDTRVLNLPAGKLIRPKKQMYQLYVSWLATDSLSVSVSNQLSLRLNSTETPALSVISLQSLFLFLSLRTNKFLLKLKRFQIVQEHCCIILHVYKRNLPLPVFTKACVHTLVLFVKWPSLEVG